AEGRTNRLIFFVSKWIKKFLQDARSVNLTEAKLVEKDNQILISFIPLKALNKSKQVRFNSRGPEMRAGCSMTEHFSTAQVEYTIILTP
uniref:Uncharacterized protein n=1 Tax=Melopsittacus undulatus TaxID=13146 RepID=A0A8V5FWA9_MELUD